MQFLTKSFNSDVWSNMNDFLREKLNNSYNQSIKNRTFDNITNTQLRNASIHQDYFFLNICTYLNRHKLLYCIILIDITSHLFLP